MRVIPENVTQRLSHKRRQPNSCRRFLFVNTCGAYPQEPSLYVVGFAFIWKKDRITIPSKRQTNIGDCIKEIDQLDRSDVVPLASKETTSRINRHRP